MKGIVLRCLLLVLAAAPVPVILASGVAFVGGLILAMTLSLRLPCEDTPGNAIAALVIWLVPIATGVAFALSLGA